MIITIPAEKERKKRATSAGRIEHDAYMTPPTLVEEIVAKLVKLIASTNPAREAPRIIEPSCGDGEFIAALRTRFPNATVVGVDIREDRRTKIEAMSAKFVGMDFLTIPLDALAEADLFVTNPPFALFREFLGHMLRGAKVGTPIALLMRFGHLVGSKEAQAWWKEAIDPTNSFSTPLRQLQILAPMFPRPSFTSGGTDQTEYALGVWIKGSDNRGIFDPIVWDKPVQKRGRKPAETNGTTAPNGGDPFAG